MLRRMENRRFGHYWTFAAVTTLSLYLGGLETPLAAPEPKWQLKISNDSYLNSHQNYFRGGEVNDQFSVVGIDGSSEWHSNGWDGRIDLSAFQSLNEEKFYYNPRELYWGRSSASVQWSLGRKLNDWSLGEQLWRRGLWEPQFEWDKLWPERQGLTGFFFQAKLDRQWQLLVFASPAYIPSSGPQFDLKDGKIVSANPWFRPPVDELGVFDKKTNILYDVDVPAAEDVVSHAGGAMQLHWQDGYGFGSLGFAYKPMNQLLFKAPFSLRIDQNGNEIPLEVNVIPYVAYHRLATLQGGIKTRAGHKFWLSVTREEPEVDEIPKTWLDQRVLPATLTDIVYEHQVDPDYDVRFYLAYSYLDGGDSPSQHELVNGEYLFERRYRFQDAARVGLKNVWTRWFGKPLSSNAEFTYDFAQRGAILTTGMTVHWSRYFKVLFSADILGLVDEGVARAETGFIREYRANDRVQAGLEYVF